MMARTQGGRLTLGGEENTAASTTEKRDGLSSIGKSEEEIPGEVTDNWKSVGEGNRPSMRGERMVSLQRSSILAVLQAGGEEERSRPTKWGRSA